MTTVTDRVEMDSTDFAQTARRLNQVMSMAGLKGAAFRSPPRHPDADRTLKRNSDGSATRTL